MRPTRQLQVRSLSQIISYESSIRNIVELLKYIRYKNRQHEDQQALHDRPVQKIYGTGRITICVHVYVITPLSITSQLSCNFAKEARYLPLHIKSVSRSTHFIIPCQILLLHSYDTKNHRISPFEKPGADLCSS